MSSHPRATVAHLLTFVLGDWGDVPGRRRQAKDVSALDPALGLHVVFEGAVDPRRQIRHITGLEDQLRNESESDNQHKINERTSCT